jgi:hypothetical protein
MGITDTFDRHAAEARFCGPNTVTTRGGRRRTPTPPPTVPFAVFAHDGGLNWVRANYKRAAAGDPRNLIQNCRANAPG